MGKLKNFKGFSDKFKELLSLTPSQVSAIEETEYTFHKDYHWSHLPEHETSASAYLNKILKHLDAEQLAIYNSHVADQRSKDEKRRLAKLNKTLEFQSIRLKSLNLTNDQLKTYVNKKLNFGALKRTKMKLARTQTEAKSDVLKQKVYEEEIYPIFDAKQLEQYKELEKIEEINGEKEAKLWSTKRGKELFKHRYNIDLSEEQAEKLFSTDFNRPLKDAQGEYYSDFEMKEKERIWYQKHLTNEQFEIYLPIHKEEVQYIIESIKKSNDTFDKAQLDRTKRYLDYYVESVLPHTTEARRRIESKLTITQKEQIDEIRSFYFSQQDAMRTKYIKQHNRHYKEFKPNAFNEFQFRQKIDKINCNICYLYGYKPAKELMDSALQSMVTEENTTLKNVYAALKAFQIECYESTGGNYGAGWMLKIPIKEGEEHLEKIGILLLYPDLKKNLDTIATI